MCSDGYDVPMLKMSNRFTAQVLLICVVAMTTLGCGKTSTTSVSSNDGRVAESSSAASEAGKASPSGSEIPITATRISKLSVFVGGGMNGLTYTVLPTVLVQNSLLITPAKVENESGLGLISHALTRTISEVGMRTLSATVARSKMLEPPINFGEAMITDVDTTTLTVVADGKTFTQSAYALGPARPVANVGPARQQQRDRNSLFALINSIDDGSAFGKSGLLPPQPYVPEQYNLWVEHDEPNPEYDETVDQRNWPFEMITWPRIEGFDDHCQILQGNEADTLAAYLDDLDAELSVSTSENEVKFKRYGSLYTVALSPVLPGEKPCFDYTANKPWTSLASVGQ